MNEKSSGRIDFDHLAELFVARLRQGQRPSISEYVERHPELADEILDLFPALAEMEGLKPDPAGCTGLFLGMPPEGVVVVIPEQLGDYRILRLIGQGGMGVVYEARRESLSAHVALKVLHHRFRGRGEFLRRFRNEARSAARLHHTNIVPVFDFGEHDGILYYVMQYIPGQGLDRVLADVRRLRDAGSSALAMPANGADRLARSVAEGLVTGRFRVRLDDEDELPELNSGEVGSTIDPDNAPTAHPAPAVGDGSGSVPSLGGATGPGQARYHREVARIGAQVADALAHAHSLGVLHRDVKPSNLLLDARGDAWVADFGLAKSEEAEDLTDTGDVLGTLRYMAPERLDGKSDRRGDIYALGTTLYEMIVLRPAFDAPDRARLVRQILEEDPPTLRKLDRRVPRDLETIVQKAMARDASARYQTAGELAEDLRLFLQDRPIAARRSTPAERTWRWCRRNKVVAALAASLLVVFLVSFVAVTAALVRARADRKLADTRMLAAQKSESIARSEKARADAGFAQARSAVDDYLNKVTEDETLKETPKLKQLRRKLLESAATFYQAFLRDHRDDRSLRAEIAAVTLRLSGVRAGFSDPIFNDLALEAVTLYEALAKESPSDPAILAGRINAHLAHNDFDRAIELGETAIAAHLEDTRITDALAVAYRFRVEARREEGDRAGAVEAARRSLALNESHLTRAPDDAQVEREVTANLSDLSMLLTHFGRSIDSLSLSRKLLAHDRGLVARYPDRLLYQQDLLVGIRNVALLDWHFGNKDQALARLGEALARSRELAAANPDVAYFNSARFGFAATIGDWLAERGESRDEMDEEALAATPTGSKLEEIPGLVDLKAFALVVDRRIGSISTGRSALTAANQSRFDELGSRAVQSTALLADRGSVTLAELKNPTLWPNLRNRDDFRALVRRLEEGTPGVAQAVKPATANLKPATPSSRELDIRARSERADAQFAAGVMLFDDGRMDEAARMLDQARGEFESLVRDDPKSPDHRFDLARARVVRARLAYDIGRLPEAFEGWLAARDLQLSVAADPASDPSTIATCRDAMLDLGSFFCERGLWDEAEASFERGLALATPVNAADDLKAGLNCLLAHDETGYRRTRDRALARNRSTNNAYIAADVAMLAAISPDPALDRAALVPLAVRGLDMEERYWRMVYLALTYLRAGRLDEAAKQLDAYDQTSTPGVERVDEITALGYTVRAMVTYRLGRADDARRALARSRRLLDDLGMRFLERPLGEHGVGFWGWAACRILMAEARAEIERRPERPEPWTDLMNAWAESQVGRPDRARAALSRIAPKDAQTASVCAARARVLLALGDTDRARQDLEAAIRLDPENVLALITRGRLALAENRPEAAADNLARALGRWPDSRDEFDLRAGVDRLIASSDAVFARAVSLRPDDPQLWVARGRHLAWLGRWKDASDAYSKGFAPRRPSVDWIEYGAVLVLAGDQAGSRRLCDQMVELLKQPGSDRDLLKLEVAARLSRNSVASGVPPELIVRWADAALRIVPDNRWYDYLAGAARLRGRGQDESALRMLNTANRGKSGWHGAGMFWYALAIAHRRLGHDGDARRWLDRADAWMADRDREAASDSTVEPKNFLRDYLEAKILEREAKS